MTTDTTLTDGTTTLHPLLWMDYESSSAANTIVHQLASGRTAITIADHGPRRVTIALLFADEETSRQCEDLHRTPTIITITEDGRPTAGMQYITIGPVRRTYDPKGDVWIVGAEVQEVEG